MTQNEKLIGIHGSSYFKPVFLEEVIKELKKKILIANCGLDTISSVDIFAIEILKQKFGKDFLGK